ncbi:MAG: GPGG-motif small membrane protein [Propionibacteriales bacterium]|nr:GPGG-motif small membrane protein [Propionibacteriales bacterium]
MGTILWLLSVVLVIVGIVELIQGALLVGIVLIVLGLLVGPGGVSVFNGRRA